MASSIDVARVHNAARQIKDPEKVRAILIEAADAFVAGRLPAMQPTWDFLDLFLLVSLWHTWSPSLAPQARGSAGA